VLFPSFPVTPAAPPLRAAATLHRISSARTERPRLTCRRRLPALLAAVIVSAVLGGALVDEAAAQVSVTLAGVQNGQLVSGSLPVGATVSGTIDRIEFLLDGRWVRTQREYPYCMASDAGRLPCYGWNSAQVGDGQHVITAAAYDRYGRRTTATATITVRNVQALRTQTTSGSSSSRFDVMSYNINWGGVGGANMQSIAKVIASNGAEVVGVQEIRRFWGNAGENGNFGCKDWPAVLASMLGQVTGQRWYSVYSPETIRSTTACVASTGQVGYDGVAVLSRYPIVSSASYKLPYGRGLAKAVISVPGRGQVTVFTTHLDHISDSTRTTQAREVVRIVQQTGGAVFLTGDMNASPGQMPILTLETALRDTWKEKGVGDGATRNGRIDYVFYDREKRLESVQVIQNWTSDHRPVMATFSLD
jgi:endonuclease/exonuclease/phosphatase family metal-dependent hydrolase